MRGGKNGGKDNFQRLELKPEVGFFLFVFGFFSPVFFFFKESICLL